MAKRGLKFILVEANTKRAFDELVSVVMTTTDQGIRITQDYVIREMIDALSEKLAAIKDAA